MNLEITPSTSSLIYPLRPLRALDAQEHYPAAYMRALNQFYIFFDQMVKEYFLPQGGTNRLESYRKFQEKFSFVSNKITLLSTQQEISINSKQARLLLSADTFFRRSFDQKAHFPRKSQPPVMQSVLNKQQEELPSHFCMNPHNSGKEILSLPKEVLSLIFSYIADSWQSVGKLAITCKNFSHIIEDPHCLNKFFETSPHLFPSITHSHLSRDLLIFTGFHPVCFGHIHMNVNDADLALIASQGSNLESISLLGSQFTPQGLAHFIQCCPCLRSLEFYQCGNFNFDDYMTVVSLYANQLEHLKISDCQMSDQSLFSLSLSAPPLRSFEYENNLCIGSITDYGLISFLSRMSQLESIKLTGCPKVTQASIISYINHSIDPITRILKGHLLKHLNFSYCSVIDASLFNYLAHHCPNLESLELGFATTQCISDCFNKRAGLLNVAINCSNLRSLKLKDCTYLSSKDLRKILNHCRNLIQLELSGNNFSQSLFNHLFVCKQLKYLKLHPMKPINLSQQHFAHLKKCTQLERLALVNCKLEENQLVSYLQNAALKQLQIMNCGAFGSPLLIALAQYCPTLENLEIEMTEESHSQPFDDISIGQLAKSCPLKMLTLKSDTPSQAANHPWQFSALSLQHLAEHCPSLSHLNLSHLNLLPSTNLHLSVEKTIHFFTRRCLNITHLGLPAIQATKNQVLSLILPYQQQLSSLYLVNNEWLDVSFLHSLSACSRLLYLWLKNTSIQSRKEVSPIFQHINYLDIY